LIELNNVAIIPTLLVFITGVADNMDVYEEDCDECNGKGYHDQT